MSTSRDFKDFNLLFKRHPATKDVVKVTGKAAVDQSVRNLVLTQFYQRPYRASLGSKVAGLLFENMDPVTEELISDTIYDVINQYEPRAEVQKVDVYGNESMNGYEVTIYYKLINVPEPVTVNLFLERKR